MARYCVIMVSMAKQETLITKKRRGPKPTGINRLIGVRLPPSELSGLDAYIAKSGEGIGRPEAIRRILADYLKRRGMLG